MRAEARYYVAGLLHGMSAVLVVGWIFSHGSNGFEAFGPKGLMPVYLIPGLVVMGALLPAVGKGFAKRTLPVE